MNEYFVSLSDDVYSLRVTSGFVVLVDGEVINYLFEFCILSDYISDAIPHIISFFLQQSQFYLKLFILVAFFSHTTVLCRLLHIRHTRDIDFTCLVVFLTWLGSKNAGLRPVSFVIKFLIKMIY